MSVRHPGRHRCRTHIHNGRPHTVFFVLLALTGCGTLKPMPLSELDSGSPRYRSASPPFSTPPPPEAPKAAAASPVASLKHRVRGRLVKGDALVEVLLRAGLADAEALLPDEAPLTPEDAAALFDALLAAPVTVGGFGPRLVASRLLREVVEGDVEVPRAQLLERLKRFERLAVLRPDGYLARALTGTARQRVGEVQWREGAFRAGRFEVGAFYSSAMGVWRPVDAQLQLPFDSPVLGDVLEDGDALHRAVDGEEETFIELVLVLGQLLTRSGDSHIALSQLPEGLATLVTSSPGYLERFREMTHGEQVKALSRLAAVLLSTWGTASGTTRTLAALGHGWEAISMPVLSLTAEGALVVERSTVGVGQTVTGLGSTPGAAVIPSQPMGALPPAQAGASGAWGPSRESRSPRAARYLEQLTGRPASEAYWLGEVGTPEAVRFDGFKDGVLLEARGPGYASRFGDDLAPRKWFRDAGAKAILDEARRQAEAARARGVRVRWHVAEEKAAKALQRLLGAAGHEGIEVVHTPAAPPPEPVATGTSSASGP